MNPHNSRERARSARRLGRIWTPPPAEDSISLSSFGGEGWGEEAALSESRPRAHLPVRLCPSPRASLAGRGSKAPSQCKDAPRRLAPPPPLPQWFWRTVPALAAAAAALCGCSDKSGETSPPKNARSPVAVPVVVAQAEAKDVPVELRNIGNVEAYSTVTVRSQITGQIIKVHFREGQDVKAGDLLFTIDPRPAEGMLLHAQADLKRDEAQLVSARLEFQREQKLLESSIASRDDYDKAEAAFHALEASVLADQSAISNAALNVEFTAIRSLIDGRTGNLAVKEGNIVKAPDDALVTINQVHPIYVTFSVPEQDLPAIRRRMQQAALPVEAQVTGEADDPPRGHLSFIDNAVDATTGRIKLKATFPNTDNTLWPGQFVQTTLVLSNLAQATVVPSQAVQSSQSGDFVFVVKADATVQKRPVALGLSRSGVAVIQRGVSPGETVVIDGQLRLAEGSKVTAQNAPSPAGVDSAGTQPEKTP